MGVCHICLFNLGLGILDVLEAALVHGSSEYLLVFLSEFEYVVLRWLLRLGLLGLFDAEDILRVITLLLFHV